MDFNELNLKKPESKGILLEKVGRKRGRKAGRKLTAKINMSLTEQEMKQIVELADEQGTSYSQTVRTIVRAFLQKEERI